MDGIQQFQNLLCALKGEILALKIVNSVLISALEKTHGEEIRTLIEEAFSNAPWPDDLDRDSPEFLATLEAFESAAYTLKQLVRSEEANPTDDEGWPGYSDVPAGHPDGRWPGYGDVSTDKKRE